MRGAEWLVLYGVIGAAVAAAQRRVHGRGVLAALLLWPFFLPGLMPGGGAAAGPVPAACLELVQALEALGGGHAERCAPSLAAVAAGLGRLEAQRREIAALSERLAAGPEGPARSQALARLAALEAENAGALARSEEAVTALAARLHLARITGLDPGQLSSQLSRLAADVDAATEVARLELQAGGR
jgi:hypothetical protein